MITVVPYGMDLTEEGKTLGPETRARLRGAASVFHQQEDAYIVVSPGCFRDYPEQIKSMAAMMADYLVSQENIPHSHVYIGEPAWNTAGETQSAIATIRKNNLPKNVVAVSSTYHCARIKLLWKQAGWNITVHRVAYSIPALWRMREWIAFAATAARVNKSRIYSHTRRQKK